MSVSHAWLTDAGRQLTKIDMAAPRTAGGQIMAIIVCANSRNQPGCGKTHDGRLTPALEKRAMRSARARRRQESTLR